ncbi:acetyltransferase [Paenibacillus alginolyticus]|uniref:acetyltransferase n=1 Tax=Paenibacillus alginolyticus TaxID=59839 RepID=UPI0003F4C5BB|nr:acetyltransferase [Paenibacillus alginolyticus]MCY9664519.1 acetyltransferase [Paenibacillus alginolyticus]
MGLVVIGEGGHSKVIREIIRSKSDYKIIAILDDKYDELTVINDIYIGPISSAHLLLNRMNHLKFVIAIGNNEVRKLIVAKLGLSKECYISLIHDTAVVSTSASIGDGTVIMAGTIVNADAVIGDHVIINSGAIVEHDSQLGDYVHIAPRATLTGSVIAEAGAMIGAGATIIPGIKVGEWAVIGAGATVISDIPSYSTAVGTPARLIARAMFV